MASHCTVGGALGGGQLSFGGAEDLALALSPANGHVDGPYGSYDTHSAWLVRKGESVPEAELARRPTTGS